MIARRFKKPNHGVGFGGVVSYALREDKVSHSFGDNITSTENAIKEMTLITKAAGITEESKLDPVVHMMLSWNKHEHPTKEQIEECAKDQIRALGYENHQWVAAVHSDTDHTHVHIIINKINPYDFRSHDTRDDYFTMDKAARESEIKQGWSHDTGIYAVEYVDGKPLVVETRDRALLKQMIKEDKIKTYDPTHENFSQYIKENHGIQKSILKAQSWQQIHDRLSMIRLEFLPDHAGKSFKIKDSKSGAITSATTVEGFIPEDILQKLGEFTKSTRGTEHEVQTALDDLTRTSAWFSERDLDSYLVTYISTQKERDRLKQDIVDSIECVHLTEQKQENREGNGIPRFTTRAVIAEETECLHVAARLAAKAPTLPTNRARERAISSRSMEPEQLDSFNKTLDGGGLSAVVGKAGVGKGYNMSALREAWEDSGYDVIGLAPTNELTASEKRDGFDKTSTIDMALINHKNRKLDWNSKTVLIVDEAGMISNDRLLQFLKLAEEYKVAKIVLIGDPGQLPSVERGGLFQDLITRYGAGELTQIKRQKEVKQRNAAQAFSEGRFEDGMHIFHETGRIKWAGNDDDSRELLLEKWTSDYKADPKSSRFVISYCNADVDYFNNEIHKRLKDMPELSGFCDPKKVGTSHGTFEFCLNEEIQFSKSAKKLGITNGLRGTISSWTKKGMIVDCGEGNKVTIDFSEFDNFRAAHAGTVYKSQGKSIANVYLHHTRHWQDAAGYVALTRQTQEATIFASKESGKDWREIAKQMSRSMIKTTATSCGVIEGHHQIKEVAAIMDAQAAQKLRDIAVTKKIEDKKDHPEKSKLGDKYKEEIAAQQREWLERMGAAKALRDIEINAARSSRELMKNTKNISSKEYDRKTISIIKEIKEKHKAAVAEVQLERPRIKNYSAWLLEHGHKEKPALEEFTRQKMIDLNLVMNMNNNWKHDTSRNDHDALHYHNINTKRHIIVHCDQNGSGVRWYEPEKKAGGSFDSLAAELALSNEQKQRLINEAPKPAGELCDHRQLTFKSALALWNKAKKPTTTSPDPQHLRNVIGKKFDQDAKVVTRPYGEVSLIASRNDQGDIVAIELISDNYKTITRSSNARAAHVGKGITERIMQPLRKDRQLDETAEIKAILVALRKMDLTRPTAQLSDKEINQGRIAAAHLKKHKPTQTATEKQLLRSWDQHERELERRREVELERERAADAARSLAAEAAYRAAQMRQESEPEPEYRSRGRSR